MRDALADALGTQRADTLVLSIFECFGSDPGRESGSDERAGDEMIEPIGIGSSHDQHPSLPEGIIVKEPGPALQVLVRSHHCAVESSARGADPLAALDGRKGPLRLEVPADALGREDQASPANSMASWVKPARMVPSASGSYQIWLSRS